MPSKQSRKEFRVIIYDDKSLTEFIESQGNYSQYFSNLAKLHMNGDLILNAKEAIETLRKEKLQVDIKSKKLEQEFNPLRKAKMEADTRLSNARATYYETFGIEPTQQAKKAMKDYATGNTEEKHDEEKIYCPDCNWHSDSKNSIQWQIDRTVDHIKSTHDRNLTQDEADTLARLIK